MKHDASSVMELVRENGDWHNGIGEIVDVEDEFVYPLVKGSDVRKCQGHIFSRRGVIVPQKEIGEDTTYLERVAPRLWTYLLSHRKVFESRKSSIYKSKSPFSVFGIGRYSFTKYKIVVSGLHKEARFVALGLINGKPALCDDTCYLLPCESSVQAATIAAILNHPLCSKFIASITSRDAKRPVTKAVLSRINILALARKIAPEDVQNEIASNLSTLGGSGPGEDLQPSDLVAASGLRDQFSQAMLFTP